MIDRRLVICAVLSVVAHYALARGLEQLPKHEDVQPPQKIEVRVIEPPKPPPPPEPPKEAEPPKPEPQKIVHDIPKTQPVHHAPLVATTAKNAPPSEHAVQTDATDEVFQGGSFSSASTTGSGPQVQVGNSPQAPPGPATTVKAAPAAIAAAEATKLPLPQGRCFGKYTDEAKTAGVEGTVVLDLIVGEDGRAREIQIKQGLPHGLTEAAIAALKECRFSPGERDGKPVAVRVRGFKIRFVLDTNSP
ncbi:MAG: energy transducer TonB [Acidobacteriota bacterium]